jgi:lambda family phage minor tail protein L
MKTLPAVLAIEKNKLTSTSSWLLLLDVTLTSGVVLNLVRNVIDIEWNGTTYSRFPFDIDSVSDSGKGELPTLQLTLSNVTRIIQAYLEPLDGAVGSTVDIHVVNSDYLSEDTSSLDMSFVVISVIMSASKAVFTLGAPSPFRRRFPLIRYIAGHCNWIFKGAECAYSGSSATCNKTFEYCTTLGNTKRFGGFPGLKSNAIRFA